MGADLTLQFDKGICARYSKTECGGDVDGTSANVGWFQR